MNWRTGVITALLACVPVPGTQAAVYLADPHTYAVLVRDLRPGDVLRLAPGVYAQGLNVHGLTGTAAQPIRIEAADPALRPVFLARPRRNTVSIVDAMHVQIRGLHLEGRNIPVDAVKAEGHARYAHFITLENLRITGHALSQQNVGISTKCPAAGWVVRGNEIAGAGTGMYFGNSDGTAPFWGGIIERNVVRDTLGYSVQVKHQLTRPALDGDDGPAVTVIRDNVFDKSRSGSAGELARPNLLVGHQPREGRGADDRFLIHGNTFLRNPHEVLFQGEGNLVLQDNLFFNPDGSAVLVRPHNALPQDVFIVHNTVIARDAGIRMEGANPLRRQRVEGNAVFAETPFSDPSWGNNVSGAVALATVHLSDLGQLPWPDVTPTAALVRESAKLNWSTAVLSRLPVERPVAARGRRVAGAAPEALRGAED